MLEKLSEQFKGLPSWQKYLILAILPIALSIYLWSSLILPLRDEVSKLEFKKQEEERALKKLEASLHGDPLEGLRKQEEALKQELASKEQELDQLVGSIPTEKDMGKVVNYITALANRNGVTILSLKIASPQEVTYVVENIGDSKIVKELSTQVSSQQTPTQQKPKQQKTEQKVLTGVTYYKVETSINLTGKFKNIRSFLDGLSQGGFVSYPLSIGMKKTEGESVQAELVIVINLKKGGV